MDLRGEMEVVPVDSIARSILILRGQKVLLDRELAKLYGIKPIALRQQVTRNPQRFPEDFLFRLNDREIDQLLSESVIPPRQRLGDHRPCAFTREGVAMLAGVLRTPQAVHANVAIMRAFVKLREPVLPNRDLAKRLDELESQLTTKVTSHDHQLSTHDDMLVGIFNRLRQLTSPPEARPIGFTADFRGK